MHVGLSLVDLAMGGAQVLFVQLAQGLSARGHDVSYWLATPADDATLVQPALKAALDEAAKQVTQPWDLWRCDVIHMDGYHSRLRKLVFVPRWQRCLETYHSQYSVERAAPMYPPCRVAVSEVVAALLPPPVHVIYQGLPEVVRSDDARVHFDVAILGRIHPVKGHELFLQACEKLHERRGSCRALIIGGHPRQSPHQRTIDDEIERLRSAGVEVTITGNVSPQDVSKHLSEASVLLVTSLDEGFGRMALEAMAVGVPVVASAVGGLREIIDDGNNGMLVEGRDADAFATQATRLLDDAALRDSLIRNGRELVRKKFSFDHMLSEYEKIYEQIAR